MFLVISCTMCLKINFSIYFSFYFVCILSSLLSDNVLLSFGSLFYFRIGIFCLLISYLIDKDKNILNYFYALIVTFVFLIVYAFIQYIFELNVYCRVSSFFETAYFRILFIKIIALIVYFS